MEEGANQRRRRTRGRGVFTLRRLKPVSPLTRWSVLVSPLTCCSRLVSPLRTCLTPLSTCTCLSAGWRSDSLLSSTAMSSLADVTLRTDITHNASVQSPGRCPRGSSPSPLVYSVLVEDKQVNVTRLQNFTCSALTSAVALQKHKVD